jgi:hypothetical protein
MVMDCEKLMKLLDVVAFITISKSKVAIAYRVRDRERVEEKLRELGINILEVKERGGMAYARIDYS